MILNEHIVSDLKNARAESIAGAVGGDKNYGFLENLRSCEKNFAFSSSPVLILGAGGAARSISFALKSKGCKNIRILSRRLSQAQGLSRDQGNCSKSYDFKYQKNS